jgi:hypothetical protein
LVKLKWLFSLHKKLLLLYNCHLYLLYVNFLLNLNKNNSMTNALKSLTSYNLSSKVFSKLIVIQRALLVSPLITAMTGRLPTPVRICFDQPQPVTTAFLQAVIDYTDASGGLTRKLQSAE